MFARKFTLLPLLTVTAFAFLLCTVEAQTVGQFHAYKIVPRTVYDKRPTKITRWVEEQVSQKQQVTSYKMIWQTEPREKRTVTYKPIRVTREREEKSVVLKPVTETKYRQKRIEETSMETVTEMREQQVTVRKPVRETQMREENVTVRKPVTKQMIEVKKTTSYRPVIRQKTELAPTNAIVSQFSTAATGRPRVQRLAPGYYTDPVTGQVVFRRRGLHWVQPTTTLETAAVTPVLAPQQVNETAYVPETVETRKPVEITRMVDTIETRKIPVEVTRMVETVETRKVPVTVQVPRTKVRIEEIPYTSTTYQEQVVVKKIPYTETEYQKVVTVEPYEVEVPRWVAETKQIDVPRTVTRRVDEEIMQDVARTVMMKVPVDICGNELGAPIPLTQPRRSTPQSTGGSSTKTDSSVTQTLKPKSFPTPSLPTETTQSQPKTYWGTNRIVTRNIPESETAGAKSILVPTTDPNSGNSTPNLAPIPRAATPNQAKEIREVSGREEKSSDSQPEPKSQADDQGSQSKTPSLPAVPMPEDEPASSNRTPVDEPTPALEAPRVADRF